MVAHPERSQDIARASYFLAQGRVVAFPTGTSYGLAVDALKGWALQRLRQLKQRPQEKTFTVFLPRSAWPLYLHLEPLEQQVLERLADQPLTLLVRPRAPLAHLAVGSRIGIRHIDHPLMQALADHWDGPLTATSANRAGRPPCYTPEAIIKEFPAVTDDTTYDLALAAILDAGPLPTAPPTTIARLDDGQVHIVRAGAVTAQAITAALA